ncbi:MAG TPA: ABC transporter substrate-binding protein [Ruminiclostridium sp.]|nr:ABC transporter substrate-binding protein [Ruminiclostridium sp.]
MKKVNTVVFSIILVMGIIFIAGAISSIHAKSSKSSSSKMTMSTKPIEFSVYLGVNNTNNWDTSVEKKITELTGVTLKIEKSIGDGKQRIALMAASGDLPDIIFAGTDLNLLLDVNQVEKLDGLIDKYGPNIKKLYGDYLKRLKWSPELPNIYCLGDQPVGDGQGDAVGGFCVQHAVVKEEGYPKLRTVNDYENVIKTYYAKHPTFKGKDGKELPTIPLLLNGYDWGYFFSIGNPANYAVGGFDDEWVVDQKTLEAKRHVLTESNKKYFKWLNGMWNQNLIDKESFTETDEQYQAKLSSGRVLATINAAPWEFQYGVHPALRGAGMEDRAYGAYPITLNENYKNPQYVERGYIGFGSGIAITTKCKDKVRAMQFLNWMASEEAQVLNAWGVEGVHWKYDADKKRVMLPDVLKQKQNDRQFARNTGIGLYAYPWPRYGNTYKDSTGNPVTPDVIEKGAIISNYTQAEKEVLTGYGVEMWKELFPQKNEFKVVPYGAAFKYDGGMGGDYPAISNKCLDLTKRYCAKLIMAEPGEFDTIWAKFVKDMEAAGVREIEKQFTQALKDRMKLWRK